MTGPGRPGREEQASLTALAAAPLGWDYPRLLLEMLSTAVPLQRMRDLKPEEGCCNLSMNCLPSTSTRIGEVCHEAVQFKHNIIGLYD
jgi:hypothetical protein